MNIKAEIQNRKNIIAESAKQVRALKRERKSIGAEIKGWNDSAERASEELEKLESGDVDGIQQTMANGEGEE